MIPEHLDSTPTAASAILVPAKPATTEHIDDSDS